MSTYLHLDQIKFKLLRRMRETNNREMVIGDLKSPNAQVIGMFG